MLLQKIGTIFRKSTKTKIWWLKLSLTLILSNLFFFLLFAGENSEVKQDLAPGGMVEVQISAELLTPFQSGKKVLLIHRSGRKKIEGMLKEFSPEQKITALVSEEEAHVLFQHEGWEILPFIKHLSFAPRKYEATHEIRY